jgi:hypothetical protein
LVTSNTYGMPDTVEVGGLTYRVICNDAEYREEVLATGFHFDAVCINEKLKIIIDPNLPLPQIRDSLAHEIEHAVAFVVGIRGETQQLGQEEWVTRTSTIRVDTYRSNPNVVAWLFLSEDDGQRQT